MRRECNVKKEKQQRNYGTSDVKNTLARQKVLAHAA